MILSWLLAFLILAGAIAFGVRLRADASQRSTATAGDQLSSPPAPLRTGDQFRAFLLLIGFMVPLAHVSLTALSLFGYRDRPTQLSWPSVVLVVVLAQLFRSFEHSLARPSPTLLRAAMAGWVISVIIVWGRVARWLEVPYVIPRQ